MTASNFHVVPIRFESPLLRCYWISLKWPRPEGEGITIGQLQPPGFGVTAFSREDVMRLLEERDCHIYFEKAMEINWMVIAEMAQIEKNHVLLNSGPVYFRGVWFPAVNLGFGASGQRRHALPQSAEKISF